MCMKEENLKEKVELIKALKLEKEKTENSIKALENEIIEFLNENEKCFTEDKNGNPIQEYVGDNFKATYSLRERENLKKDIVKSLLSKEDFEKCLSKSVYSVLQIK